MSEPDAYDVANEVELACQSQGCARQDCNGFICRNAIDATIRAERERCAKIAKDIGAQFLARMVEAACGGAHADSIVGKRALNDSLRSEVAEQIAAAIRNPKGATE